MAQASLSKVIDTHGKLPRFWDEDVVFFANLLELFFGDEIKTRQLEETVGGVDSYGGRLIPILNLIFRGEHNTLVLERDCPGNLCRYFQRELSLSLPELRIMESGEYRKLGELLAKGHSAAASNWLSLFQDDKAERVDGYVTDDTLEAIANHLGKRTIATREGCLRGNNKLLLHHHLQSAGLPTIPTRFAEARTEVPECLSHLSRQGFDEAVLKSQIGASGIGIVRVSDIAAFRTLQMDDIPEHLFCQGPIMVQGWAKPGQRGVTTIKSPSVQMFLDDQHVWLFDVTEQILSHDSIHEGNVSPPPYLNDKAGIREELFRQAGIAGQWLHDQGYRGTASTDFLFVEREQCPSPEIYVCEINARVTGATYPSILARHFTPEGAWLMRNLRFWEEKQEAGLLEMLRNAGLLFQLGRSSGILPINFNIGSNSRVHKGQFLCLGPSLEECWFQLELAETRLPVAWDTDRD